MSETQRDQKQAELVHSSIIPFRVTPEERAQIEADAERMGSTRSDYIRKVLLTAPQPRQYRRPAGNEKMLASLVGHIGKIGSNLNQIARNTNAGLSADTAFLREGITALVEMKTELKRALDRRR